MKLGIGLVLAALAASLAGCASSSHPSAGASLVQRRQTVDELVERGQAFATVGDLTRGEQYLSAALLQGADVHRVLPLLVHVCVQGGRYRVAADYVHEYLPQDPDNPTLHLLLGLLEAAVGDRQVARREYEMVLRRHPDDASTHYALAVLLRDEDGDPVAADAHFREYLRLAPGGQHAAEARSSLLEEVP
jgi:Flp pilus assembly protein TadD